MQKLLFLGFFVAFAIKAPLVPFHTWLPDAGSEAPIGGAVLLVGVLDKVGTFGFLRYCLPLFPDASRFFAPWVLVLAVVGILYAALLAMGQSDMKRLVSYTSISHFGFIALGIFAFTTEAATGAVLYMVNHGIATGSAVRRRRHAHRPRRLAADPRLRRRGGEGAGAGRGLPAGRPGVAGAARHQQLRQRVPRADRLVPVASRCSRSSRPSASILAALYILLMYQRTMQGPPAGVLLAEDDAAGPGPRRGRDRGR